MALSYLSEGEAPRDFRVSSTESDGHYTKCLLCYTVKRNFYCPECIKTGNFVHSSVPYADRYSEKQMKLMRLKANRKHVLDRCEKLLSNKIKKDKMLTEAKQSRDKLDLLRLAIEQRRNNIDEKKKELIELKQYNHDLNLKLPRYQKRVSLLGKHAQDQRIELQNKIGTYTEQADSLAAFRRSRIRQLTKYIFPVYMSYDTSDSIEDMEFVGDNAEEEPPKRSQLHIVAPWINTDGDFSHLQNCLGPNKDCVGVPGGGGAGAGQRAAAALALAAQLVALLAWTLDARLPHTLALTEYCNWRVSACGLGSRARRLHAGVRALCCRAGLRAPSAAAPATYPYPSTSAAPAPSAAAPAPSAAPAPAPAPALAALHALTVAASADDPLLGRVEGWMCSELADAWGGEAGEAEPEPDDNEPEHLHWPEAMDEIEELSCTPPTAAPAASLVTSAAASLASLWRGWAK